MRKTIGVMALSLALIVPAQIVLSAEYIASEKAYKKAQKRLAVIERKNPRVRKFFQEQPAAKQAFILIGELIFTRDEVNAMKRMELAKMLDKEQEWTAWDEKLDRRIEKDVAW